MKNLLAVTAVFEAGTGLLLVTFPSALAVFLLASTLDTPVGLTIARVAGFALLALGTACWLARRDGQTPAARGLAVAMMLCNAGAAGVLGYAAVVLGLSGVGLWPAVVAHAGMASWCIKSILRSHP